MGLAWPIINRRRAADRRIFWPLAWLGITVLFFTCVSMKKNSYILPTMPAQTLLIAAPIVAMLRPYATESRHDAESRAILNWHGAASIMALTVTTYLIAPQLVDPADYARTLAICGAVAVAIAAVTLLRIAAVQPRLLARFAVAAIFFAAALHMVVAWLEPANEIDRFRRIAGFTRQVASVVRRAPLYSVGGIREDVLYYLGRPVFDLGSMDRIPADFQGYLLISEPSLAAVEARHAEIIGASPKYGNDVLYICYLPGTSGGPPPMGEPSR
jgi:4-amino-4-deoxy-L-arabinose transferase-like glycosyltransferase